MHISKPPHYWKQEGCLGTGTTSVCVPAFICLCVHDLVAHLSVWLTELARPITLPQSVQLL